MLLGALAITWAFWLSMIGLLAWWRRSWVNVLAFPVVFTAALWGIALLSDVAALVVAGVFHGLFAIRLIVSMICDRRPGDDRFWDRPAP